MRIHFSAAAQPADGHSHICRSPWLFAPAQGMKEPFLQGSVVIFWLVRRGLPLCVAWLEWIFFNLYSLWQPLGVSLAPVKGMSHYCTC